MTVDSRGEPLWEAFRFSTLPRDLWTPFMFRFRCPQRVHSAAVGRGR
jgi:hypothetical protein